MVPPEVADRRHGPPGRRLELEGHLDAVEGEHRVQARPARVGQLQEFEQLDELLLPAVVLHGHVPGPEGRSGLSECPAGEAEVPIWRSWHGPWTATPRGPCSWPGACRGPRHRGPRRR